MSSKSGGGGLTVFAGLGVLFGAVIGCGLVGLAVSDATRAATSAAGSGLTRLASDNRDAVNVGFIIVTAGVPTLALLGAVVALAVWAVKTLFYVKPDQAGRLPLTSQQHATDTGLVVTARSLDAYHQTQLAAANNPRPLGDVRIYRPVVGALTAGARPQVETPALAQPVAAPMLPGPVELHALGHTPTLQSILLGLTAGGDRVTVPARDLMHVLTIGASGQGKTNVYRLLMSQLLAAGASVNLIDPHFTPRDVDARGDGDWALLAERLTVLAVRPAEIRAALADMLAELDRRLEARYNGQRVGGPVFYFADELPALRDLDPMVSLGRALREGRKVGLYVVASSQDGLVKTLGGSTGVQQNARTLLYAGGDAVSARRLLGVKDTHEQELGRGVALLKCAALPEPELARIPWASDQAVYSLLGGGGRPARGGGGGGVGGVAGGVAGGGGGVRGGGDRGGGGVATSVHTGVDTSGGAVYAYPTPPEPVLTRPPLVSTPVASTPPDLATSRNVGPTPAPAPSWPIPRRPLTEAEAAEVRAWYDNGKGMSKNKIRDRVYEGSKDTVTYRWISDALAAAPTTTKASGE